jgi:hypothetical protein
LDPARFAGGGLADADLRTPVLQRSQLAVVTRRQDRGRVDVPVVRRAEPLGSGTAALGAARQGFSGWRTARRRPGRGGIERWNHHLALARDFDHELLLPTRLDAVDDETVVLAVTCHREGTTVLPPALVDATTRVDILMVRLDRFVARRRGEVPPWIRRSAATSASSVLDLGQPAGHLPTGPVTRASFSPTCSTRRQTPTRRSRRRRPDGSAGGGHVRCGRRHVIAPAAPDQPATSGAPTRTCKRNEVSALSGQTSYQEGAASTPSTKTCAGRCGYPKQRLASTEWGFGMASSDTDSTHSSGIATVTVAGVVFALVLNAMFFTSAGTGLLYLYLAVPATFAFGSWMGYRLNGRSTAYYLVAGLVLGLLAWVIFLIGVSYYDVQGNAFVSFVRVCVSIALLSAGGALLGDMIARRRLRINIALLASITAFIGAIVGFLQLFV